MLLLLFSFSLASDLKSDFGLDQIEFEIDEDYNSCAKKDNMKDNLLMCKKDISELLYKMKTIIESQNIKEKPNATK